MPWSPPPPLGSDLTTLDTVKAWLGEAADMSQDARLTQLITAASSAVANYLQREPTPTSGVTRRFRIDPNRRTPLGHRLIHFGRYDLRSITQAALNPEETPILLVAGTDYELRPGNSLLGGTYSAITISRLVSLASTYQNTWSHSLLDLTGDWGWPSVPADVEQATIITVAKWFKRDQVAWSDELPTPTPSDGLSLPYDCRLLLSPYRRILV